MQITLEHPFFNVREGLLKLCKPLFTHTPITFFDYGRYYYDGYCVFLCQEKEVDFEVLRNDLVPRLEELHRITCRYFVLSTVFQNFEAALYPEVYSKNIDITCYANVHHRLFIVFKYTHYLEMFEFGIDNVVKNVFEFFLNHVKKLERFCVYFRETGSELINYVNHSKVLFDYDAEPKLFTELARYNEITDDKFYKSIEPKKIRVQGKVGEKTITKREFECLLWCIKDKTAKQIARILSLSPRTVEEYLGNLKNKLGCRSKYELIEIASKNSIIKAFEDIF